MSLPIKQPDSAWTAEKVTAFADEGFPNLQPPINELEAEAIAQLTNGTKLTGVTLNSPIEGVRFAICTALDKQRYGQDYDERHLALNGIFHSVRGTS